VSGRGRLLDLGCGPGRVTLPLARYFREVQAVDLEPEMVEVGRGEAVRLGITNILWCVGRAEDCDAPPASFELVTMGESFHRFDQLVVLKKIQAWLQPGGYVAALGGMNPRKHGEDEWCRCYREVWDRWARPGAAAAHPAASQPSMTSGLVFATAGFEDLSEEEFTVPHVWTVESLVGIAFSTSVMSRKALGANAARFEADVRATLLALNPRNEFPEALPYWCAVARRST